MRSSTHRASRRARRGTRTAVSRPSRTSWTAIFEHQDSNGGGGVITNGDTQWMTAGAGILHIEKPPEHLVMSGGLFHGLQLWVNLPKAREVGRAPLPGPARQRGRPAGVIRRRSTRPGDRRRPRGTVRARRHLHADDHGARHGVTRRHPGGSVGSGVQRARLRARRSGDRGCREDRGRHGAARGLRPRETRSPCRRPKSRRAVHRRSRCCCSAADRSGSRWRGWGRSS